MCRLLLALVLGVSLAACGGDGGAITTQPGPGGAGNCQDDFTPERVAAGENCDPDLNRGKFCPLLPASEYTRSRSEVIPCDGVSISIHAISGGGFGSEYIAIRPSGGGEPSAVYLALHYLGASADFFANLIRMTELAKARNVLVLVPQAPGAIDSVPVPDGLPATEGSALSRWPTSLTQPVESYLQFLDAVVADGRLRFGGSNAPLYAAGLSNGVPMAYFYACGRAGQVDAVLAVAGTQNQQSASVCSPTRPVGLVIVHGTLDPIIPYGGLLGLTRAIPDNYQDFKLLNQCVGSDGQATLEGGGGAVEFDYAPNCAGGRRVVLASLIGNGHNWPGDDAGALQEMGVTLGLFGLGRNDIDATLQGFDLLRYSAGR